LTTKIVAVDPVGSVTFGNPSAKRHIPGLGTSRRPEITPSENIDQVILIPEAETVQMAHDILARYSLLIGPSTATVLRGVQKFQEEHSFRESDTIVAISPDMGDKYIDTVYNKAWVKKNYGAQKTKSATAAVSPHMARKEPIPTA